MKPTYTSEQSEAISRRGKVIVSASAGSGKTFVMIERLVSLILGGADVRQVLAVTFTKKAAAQMREKLRTALIRKISECQPEEKARLKEQLAALPAADISTIHSFCGRLIRSHFFLAETDASFRIVSSDDSEGADLLARALDEVFDGAYEEGDEDFLRLLTVYFKKKKDDSLREIVKGLYMNYRGMANYREALAKAGDPAAFAEACGYLAEEYRGRAADCLTKAEELERALSGNKTAERLCKEVAEAAGALTEGDLFELAAAAREPRSFSASPRVTAKTSSEERRLIERLKRTAAAVKKIRAALSSFASQEEERARFDDAALRARALAKLVLRFDDAYARWKRERGVLDYNDLEHGALKVLSDASVLRAVREKYRYVFVDEYQDVNPVQEKILSLVGGDEVFLVGDMKQSIYGFRGSKSEFFAKKCREFPASLRLTENFRSAESVLEAVNRVFRVAMRPETCGFSYAEEEMRGGRRYGEHRGSVKFHLLPAREKAEKKERGVYSVLTGGTAESADPAAEAIARIVSEEVGKEYFDADTGTVRRVGYGDIAVLTRKKSGMSGKVVACLSERDIPVTSSAEVNICDYWEVRLLLDWLSFLDNMEQDIPLAGAMLSSLGSFTDDELARIRLESAQGAPCYYFRDACRRCARQDSPLGEKLRAFFALAERLRTQAYIRTAKEMLVTLLAEGLETEIACKKDGRRRLQRVRRLIAEAEGSVHAFLDHVRRLGNRIGFSESGGDGAVRVVTMHAAKGLEYPVVVLADMDTAFHGAENDETVWTERFSVAPRSFDTENKLRYDTVLRRAAALCQTKEEIKGELNLLYVAMTRAKYRLHVLFGEMPGDADPAYAGSFADFIDGAACAEYFAAASCDELPPHERRALVFRADEAQKARILEVYRKPYPFTESVALPVKDTATDLLERQERGEYRRAEGAEGDTSPETGTAYHAFLQHVDFSRPAAEELERMKREGALSEEQAALLEVDKLARILSVPCFRRLAGKEVLREQTFLVRLQADELNQTSATDEIVYQGAIDLLCTDAEGTLILDYKYSVLDDESLRRKYAVQIALYRKAAARILRVDERTVRARIVNILLCREIEM